MDEIFGRRALWLGLIMFAAILAVVYQLWHLDVGQGAYFKRLAAQSYEQQIPLVPPRGDIVAANGQVVATNRASWELEWFSQGTGSTMSASETRTVAKLLNVSPASLSQLVTKTVAAQEDYWPVVLDPSAPLTIAQLTRYEENRSSLPDLGLLAVPERYYPYGAVGGNLLGYLADISASEYNAHRNDGYLLNSQWGQAGVEGEFQQYLKGTPGYQIVDVSPSGNTVKAFGQQPAVPGDTVHLTINWNMEEVASRALAYVIKAMHDSPNRYAGGPYSPNANQGAVVVLNPENGDVLAMASYPSYNPNLMPQDYTQAADNNELLNLVYQGWFAPGSIFKPIIAGGALQSGVVKPSTVIFDPGYFTLDPSFKNWDPAGFGDVDMETAIMHSDDTYFYWVGYWMGIQRMDHYIALYGLNGKTGIDLPGELPSVMPTPARLEKDLGIPWTWGQNLNTVIGQGISEYTIIGLARAEAAVANGGTLWWPHVATSITREGKVIKTYSPRVQGHTGISAYNYNIIHVGMEMSAQNPAGTGNGAMAGIPMPVATKTGTAQTGTGQYDAFFTTFAPANYYTTTTTAPLPAPKLDIVVYIENGTFGSYSGFVARAIYDEYFHLNDPSAQTLFDSLYGLNWTWPFNGKRS